MSAHYADGRLDNQIDYSKWESLDIQTDHLENETV